MRSSRHHLRLFLVIAALGLTAVPAIAIAGLPNAVIFSGNVNGIKALQNAHHRTIYLYTRERRGQSTCYGGCLANWKPVLTGSGVFAHKGSGVNQSLLGTTRRKGGKLQVTYNKHPLYTYTGDYVRGDDNGQGCADSAGFSFWIVNLRGNAVTDFFSCQGY